MANATTKIAVVIIPTYNEKPNIQRLVPDLHEVLKNIPSGWKLQVLVVDDSSPDGTSQAVETMQKKYSFLHLLINKKKSGLGGAYLKGMAYAFHEMKADVVFEMDADLSHDPKKVPEFLRAIDDGYDLVLGSRYIAGGSIPSNWGMHRKFLSVFGNLTISAIMMNWSVRDWTGGYRALKREVYEAVHTELESSPKFSGYTFQIGFLTKALHTGFRVKEIPFHFIDRTEGESKLGTEYIVNILRYILKLRLEELLRSRIMKFLIVGGIGFVVNFTFYQLFKAIGLWSLIQEGLGSTGAVEALFSNESLAVILGAECAIVSNYTLNNLWTFSDRKIKGVLGHVNKFIQFNIGSTGSVFLQYVVMQLGVFLFGVPVFFRIVGFEVSADLFYLVAGVLLGMIWNFSIYNMVIWRKR